ncbi:restriction endonuclease [Tumebacillus permanentifrigoris]|uniref:Restriction endonuclease n=1 Tax=Tumebacillus permanentifrigoris TaxID=378543 RepID=A0A316DDR3_9BACL|nr:restriction endonuclease [Tumebacillus permanentifrigoris]PWK15768.1 restriction endonuclease [Tumebacillus permanentifrigoris]
MEIYHYPPDVLNLLVDTIPLLNRSKIQVLDFFRSCGIPNSILNDLTNRVRTSPDTITKYEIARTILTRINEKGDELLRTRREVVRRVHEFESFYLCWPEDQLKAKGLVAEVQRVVNVKDSFTRMKKAQEIANEKHRKEYQEKVKAIKERRERIENIKFDIYSLFGVNDPQKRGKELEGILNRLFREYSILVKESFTIVGQNGEGVIEQIDGVVELDNHIYLVEMKWWKNPIGRAEVSEHLVRIYNRQQARAIIISVSDFTEPAVSVCREALANKVVILMNIEELINVLEKDVDFKELLRKKVQAAIIEKEPYFKVQQGD